MQQRAVEVGPITFEFCEPLADDSIAADVLRKRGEGVFDIMFQVDDIEAEIKRLGIRGLDVHPKGRAKDRAYFDARAEGNVLLQLRQA